MWYDWLILIFILAIYLAVTKIDLFYRERKLKKLKEFNKKQKDEGKVPCEFCDHMNSRDAVLCENCLQHMFI